MNGACDVSPQAVEALIDRTRGIAGTSPLAADASGTDRALIEGQQSSVASFDIDQPLVSTHLLNGEVLDGSALEDDVQAIAASWNQSRYASRVADATPIYARCSAAMCFLFAVDFAHHLLANRCRATGPMTTRAWRAAMAASFFSATCVPLRITSSALASGRLGICYAFAPPRQYRGFNSARRCHQVVGRARTIFAVYVKRRAKTAATAFSGASPHQHTPLLQPKYFSCFTNARVHARLCEVLQSPHASADARCAHARFAKTANLMTCRFCPTTTAVSLEE